MFGYGSKLGGPPIGGMSVVAIALTAGVVAALVYRISAPDRAFLAVFLSSGLALCALLGWVLSRARRSNAAVQALPASLVLEPGQIVPWDAVVVDGESEIDNGALGGSAFAMPAGVGAFLRRGARNGDGRLQIAPQDVPQSCPAAPALQSPPSPPFPAAVSANAPRILLALLVLGAAAAIRIDTAAALLAVAAAVPPGLGLIRTIVLGAARRKARKAGVDWHDAAAIDVLATIDTVALAPGGILTRPDLTLLSLHPASEFKPAEVIAAAVTCCQSSHSDLARAVLRFAVAHKVRLRPIGAWRSEGAGLVATADLGAELALGDRDWLERHGIPQSAFDAVILPAMAPGRRRIWIAELHPHPALLGALVLGEKLKPGAAELAKNLSRLGIETELIDADATEGQLDLARQLGLGASHPAAAPNNGRRRLLIDRTGNLARRGVGAWLQFGMTQAESRGSALAAIRREDPRAILDLIRLARAARRREAMATVLAFAFCLPPVWFALGGRVAIEIALISPLLGLGAVIVSAQFLHLFQPTASEVDDE